MAQIDDELDEYDYWTDDQVYLFLRGQGHKLARGSVRSWRAARGLRSEPRTSATDIRKAEQEMVGRGNWVRPKVG